MTRARLESLEWEFAVDGEVGTATKRGERIFDVASRTPLFALIAEASAREGEPIEGEITPKLVADLSGETYAPDTTVDSQPDPLVLALEALGDRPVTASDLLAILRPDTMNTDAPPSPTDHPATGA